MEYLIIILPFLFAHLYGLFSAFMDARKDYGFMWYSKLYTYYVDKGEDYKQWYSGGNSLYPPGNPFKADFWHWSKHMTSFLISAMVLSAMLAVSLYPSPWLILYGFVYGVEGLSFTFYYSFALRKDRTWGWYIHHLFTWGWKTQ